MANYPGWLGATARFSESEPLCSRLATCGIWDFDLETGERWIDQTLESHEGEGWTEWTGLSWHAGGREFRVWSDSGMVGEKIRSAVARRPLRVTVTRRYFRHGGEDYDWQTSFQPVRLPE